MAADQQTLLGDKRYVVSLDVFEGPLDLLLHLIRKHELDIFDIPIAFVTRKYLDYLDMIQKMNLNLASEYLEMASHLAYIKSKMMLPSTQDDEDDEFPEDGPDPREELVRQLLEYQKYRTAADALLDRPMVHRDTFLKPDDQPRLDRERELDSPGLFTLLKALKDVFDRLNLEEDSNHGEIEITRISVTARIHQVLDILLEKKHLPFVELFKNMHTRANIVVSFLAILEMTKLGLARIHQAGPQTEIHISASADKAQAERVLAHSSLEDE